jgi:hypothetical protein
MAKNPFRQVEKALNPKPKAKPKPKTAKAQDLTKGGTSRQAAMRAAERKRAAERVKRNTGYSRSSTNKGRTR